ncbi:20303_t:CDS:2, partial [Gigaspora rosea]
MAFFKKFVNKFNKKESLNIECQSENFEATNKKEIINEFENTSWLYLGEVQEENCWPVIEQNFESNGWNNIKQEPASSNWMNKEPSSSTNTDETFFYEKTPSVSIEQENPSFIK